MSRISRFFTVFVLLGLLSGAAVHASPVVHAGAASPARRVVVFPVNGFNYSPSDITIAVGEDVEWSGPFAFHPLVSDDGLWPVQSSGDSFRFTFTQPGTYRYHCQIHGGAGGVGMSGVIRVVGGLRRTYLPTVVR